MKPILQGRLMVFQHGGRWNFGITSTLQPKLHIIFDVHLIDQFWRLGGIADKPHDMIEKAHQPWKWEKERVWGVKNFQMQQKCHLRAVRKQGHYKIRLKMEEVANKRRQVFHSSTPSKRAQNKATTIRE
jgi:hypothetical protein